MQKAKFVPAENKPKSPYKKTGLQTQGSPDKAFITAAATSEGVYGIPCIVHACLETHGSAIEWPAEKEVVVHVSTQNVSGIAAQLAEPLSVPAGNINVLQQNVGGGFGSKFSVDRWDVNTGNLSKKAGGKPVKNMLDRKAEAEVAGMRPSAYARVKIAADQDGKLVAWESRSWGTGGVGGGGTPPLPYIFEIPNQRKQNTAISTNQGSARAWRAPNHPQAAVITMGAIDDLAAKMKMDPLDPGLEEHGYRRPARANLQGRVRHRRRTDGMEEELAPARRQDSGQHQARTRPFDAHLGRPRPQQQSGFHHPP